MADIEFTFDELGGTTNYLQFAGRVGQTVAITLAIPTTSPVTTQWLQVAALPVGLRLDGALISGTLAMEQSVTGHVFFSATDSGSFTGKNLFLFVTVLPANAASLSTPDAVALLEAANGSTAAVAEEESTPGSGVTLTPDPAGYITAANAGADVAKEWDYDLGSDIVFDPRDADGAVKGGAAEGTADFPEWAPDTFSTASILRAKLGQRWPVALGLNRDGVLQDFDVADISSITIHGRQSEESPLIVLSEAGFTKMTSLARYKVVLDLDQAALANEVADFIGTDGGYIDLRCEVVIVFALAASAAEALTLRSDNFAIRLVSKVGDIA